MTRMVINQDGDQPGRPCRRTPLGNNEHLLLQYRIGILVMPFRKETEPGEMSDMGEISVVDDVNGIRMSE